MIYVLRLLCSFGLLLLLLLLLLMLLRLAVWFHDVRLIVDNNRLITVVVLHRWHVNDPVVSSSCASALLAGLILRLRLRLGGGRVLSRPRCRPHQCRRLWHVRLHWLHRMNDARCGRRFFG